MDQLSQDAPLYFLAKRQTAGVTCVWAGADKAWEEDKLEARKMLAVGAAESHMAGNALLGRRWN